MSNAVLQRYVDERTQTQQNIDRLLDRANEEERDLTESERELIVGHRQRLDQLEPMIGEILEVEETREKAKDARSALTRRRNETPEGEPPAPDPAPDDDDGDEGNYPTFARYARDAMLTRFSYIGATVEPHVRSAAQRRMKRAIEQVLVASVPGITLPQHLAEIMQVIDKSRPIVDSSRRVSLTSGKVQYPFIANRPDVAEQLTEKTEVGDGSMQVTMLEEVAKTYLTAANFSWQVIQWSNPDALALWFDLAAESYALKTEAAAGAALAAADATPAAIATNDLGAWMAAITKAAGEVYTVTGRFANTIYADPVTGFGLLGLVSATAPTFLATGQGNLSGSFPSIGGLRFIISKGLPASTVVVGDSSALLTAETAGSPVELRAVEPSIGGLEVGIIGAFLAEVTEAGAFVELTPPAPV